MKPLRSSTLRATVLGILAAATFVAPAAARADVAVQVAAGSTHTCALTDVGGVQCWGANASGQLGDGTTIDAPTAVNVVGLSSGVVAIAAGYEETCAVTATGGVKCWGRNEFGQLGDGTTTSRSTPVDVSGLSAGVSSVTVGSGHVCVLTSAGGVKCWGQNSWGQLGDGTTTHRGTPVDVNGLMSGVAAVSAGGAHSCALTTASGVKCWGGNFQGALGDSTTQDRSTPVDVVGLASGGSSVTAGNGQTCARTSSGGAQCWGQNDSGQLGDGTTIHRPTPVDVSGLGSGIASVVAGGEHSCASTDTGSVKCWGSNYYGQLGDGTTTQQLTAVDVTGLSVDIAAISVGGSHACALSSSGGVECWGYNGRGALGDGTPTKRSVPVDVIGLSSGVSAVGPGYLHSCALTTAGGVKCWGYNREGILGDGTTSSHLTPIAAAGLDGGVVALAASLSTNCVLTGTGGAKCWGPNFNGQVGDGTTTSRLTAVDVLGATSGVAAIAAADFGHTCALTTGGAVSCWGDNGNGALGDGTTTSRSTPASVSGLTSGVASIAVGGGSSCAVLTSGGVKCWGSNAFGQLGDGSTSNRLTPVDVTGLSTDVTSVSLGLGHGCALTSAGAMKCWGRNSYGELGDGTTIDRATPVDVVGLASDVTSISAGGAHTCALSVTGGVQCWGYNFYGQLGDGTTTARLTPAGVTGLASGVAALAAGVAHTCAVTTAEGAKCWGLNDEGQLGNGEASYSVRPVAAVGFGPVCGDGVVDSSEQCDDGNTASGDCCSSLCQLESSATVCRASAGDCDAAETCSGESDECPPDAFAETGAPCAEDGDACTADACDGSGTCTHAGLPDADGDLICDEQDACTNVAGGRDFVTRPRSKVILANVNTETVPGNDKLTIGASFALPALRSFADLDPRARGARLVLRTGAGEEVVDVRLPAGSYAGRGARGWKTNARHSHWQYLDETLAPLAGITSLKVTDRGKGQSGGLVAVTISGKRGTYGVATGDAPLEAIVGLGDREDATAGMCGEHAYSAGECGWNRSGNVLKCFR